MELWIRSQDKLFLGKIDKLLINGFDIFSQDQLIGTYLTYKRALEVLDEIIDLMIPTGLDENGEYTCEKCFVNKDMMYYEMPKE